MYSYWYIFLILIISFSFSDAVYRADFHYNFRLLPKQPFCSNPVESFDSTRIIGGREPSLGKYPWIARLIYAIDKCKDPLQMTCSGSLITPSVVITAAHCILYNSIVKCGSTGRIGRRKVVAVLLGEFDTKTRVDCRGVVCADSVQIIKTKGIIVHAGYQFKDTLINDIALVGLRKPAQITAWVNPICLPSGYMLYKDYSNNIVEIAGWGQAQLNSSRDLFPTVLQYVQVYLFNHSFCRAYYGNLYIPQQHLCAGAFGQASCPGDSGGPLMVKDNQSGKSKQYLLGIVSFGQPRCDGKYPSVFTNTRHFMKWILDNIRKFYQ